MSDTLSVDSFTGINEDLTLEEAYNRALANRGGNKNKKKSSAAKKLTGPALQAKSAPTSSVSTNTSDDSAHSSKSNAHIAQDGVIEASDSCLSSVSDESKAVESRNEIDIKSKIKNKMDAEDLTVKDLLDAPKSPIFEVRIRQAEVLRLAGK